MLDQKQYLCNKCLLLYYRLTFVALKCCIITLKSKVQGKQSWCVQWEADGKKGSLAVLCLDPLGVLALI